MWQEYLFPKDIGEAVAILGDGKGSARIIAGGTDLILDMEAGRHGVKTLVDLSRIEELNEITEEGGMIKIGANVTCAQVCASELIKQKAPALSQGARKLGSRQIRNIATIAGNVVRAQPAADTAIPLVALGASVEVAGPNGNRTLNILDAYGDTFAKSNIDSTCEVLSFLHVPVQGPWEGSAYIRLDKRKALSLPILNVACKISLAGETITGASIAMGPVGPGPRRATEAENRLVGGLISPETVLEASKLVVKRCDPRDSLVRGSKKYRMSVISTLAEMAITQAVNSAQA
ncbi:MAG TPA: FAD binding domain-containing protein [Desulfobacteria bacterium]|nr:FAD binding domain-containing protein [Desulfobacteria bacterium]